MRGTSRVDFMARTGLIRFRGSKSWKEGGLLLPTPLAVGFAGLGRETGREGASFTTRPRAAMTIRRRTADSAGTEHPQHGAVDRTRKPCHRGRTCQLQHGEKVRNDALERFAVAFDGQVPVQVISYPA